MPPLECCFGTSPIQAESLVLIGKPSDQRRWRSERGQRRTDTRDPSSRLLISLDRCQALIIRSNSRIRASTPAVGRRARRDTRAQPLAPVCHLDRRRPSAAPRHDGARPAHDPELCEMGTNCIDYRGLLANEQMACARSIRQLCCSGVLVATKRMFALVTASQMASASAASFFCRLT